MNIFVSQFYTEAGASYPFKPRFQKFLSEKLSAIVPISPEFAEKYGNDFDLMFRLGAKSEYVSPVIKGPTVFKRDRDVEYTIFLPFNRSKPLDAAVLSERVQQLLECVAKVFDDLGMSTGRLRLEIKDIVDSILNDKEMIGGK